MIWSDKCCNAIDNTVIGCIYTWHGVSDFRGVYDTVISYGLPTCHT